MAKLLKKLDDVFVFSDAKRVAIEKIMDTKLFWRIYFWWEIRKAAKRRIKRGHSLLDPHGHPDKSRQCDAETYWENRHNGT